MKRRRGAILLEVIVSVAIFVASAVTLIGVLSQSDSIAARAREEQIAGDLCRSAMAQLSLGLSRPESLQGPVRPMEAEGGGFEDAPPPDSGWELKIATEPGSFSGLQKVTIEAIRVSASGARRTVTSLCQLVPTGAVVGGAP